MTDAALGVGEPAGLAAPAGSKAGDGSVSGRFFEGSDWLAFGVTGVGMLAVYLITLAPEVTLEDSGTLTAGAAYAGVPDVPGLPVWSIYSWLFARLLPLSNMAWRVTTGSAFASALACGVVALMVSRGGEMLLERMPAWESWRFQERRILRVASGWVAGMALGLSAGVWREAVVVSVVPLSLLLFAGLLCLLLRWTATPERRRYLYGAFLVYGLLLTTRQEMVTLAPALVLWIMLNDRALGRDVFWLFAVMAVLGWVPGEYGLFPWEASFTHGNWPLFFACLPLSVLAIAIVVITRRIGSEWKAVLFCGAMFLLGVGWYFYVPLASMTNPPANWGYARTVDGFYHLASRGQYEQLNPTHELGLFLRQLGVVAGTECAKLDSGLAGVFRVRRPADGSDTEPEFGSSHVAFVGATLLRHIRDRDAVGRVGTGAARERRCQARRAANLRDPHNRLRPEGRSLKRGGSVQRKGPDRSSGLFKHTHPRTRCANNVNRLPYPLSSASHQYW